MSNRPNIILINIESFDGRKMGCMGSPALRNATPGMDSLASRGILFTSAYSNCPVCNPSRASMWTGKYPHRYGCWNNHEGIHENVPILLDRLEESGYATKTAGPVDFRHGKHSIRDRVGSWTRAANIPRPLCKTPLPRVFGNSSDINAYDWKITYEAVNWLRETDLSSRPFMLYMTTKLVHPAFNALQRHMDRIDADKIFLPPEDNNSHPVFNYQRTTKNTRRGFPASLTLEIRKIYYAMISALDEMLGQLFAAVKNLGLEENTYIILTADHGEMAGEHGQILKRTMYEPSIRVPMIIAGPEAVKGGRVDTHVSLIDIYPTIMDMAGLKTTGGETDGESLMPAVTGRGQKSGDWVFAEYHGDRCNTGTFMLRKDSWKYIKYAGYEPQLFNLDEDPWEIKNLAEEKPEKARQMDNILESRFDCGAIDAEAKRYDMASFRNWRREQKEAGKYEDSMAYIYSGFDRLCIEDIMPWRPGDEKLIEQWLKE